MDIIEFFQQSAGKWFSQRTSHYLSHPKLEAGKTDLWIDILPASDPEVIKVCELSNVDPSLALLGARVKWNGTVGTNEQKQAGSTMIVPLANPENPRTGPLLQSTVNQEMPVQGRYSLGKDNALTLMTESPTMMVEERVWFESPNLRLRTSTLKRKDGFSVASMCSEIRMGGVQPASPVTTQAEPA